MRQETQPDAPPAKSVCVGDSFGLTMPQLAILFDQALHAQKPIYNTGQTLLIQGDVDLSRFKAAVDQAASENDALRLQIVQRGSQLLQEAVSDVDGRLEFVDCSLERDPDRAASTWMERVFWEALDPRDFHFSVLLS